MGGYTVDSNIEIDANSTAIYKSNESKNNSYSIYSYSTINNQDVNRPGDAIIRKEN